MRAIVLDSTVHLDERYPDPRPGAGECIVRVRLAGVCATDLELIDGYLRFRGVLGHEMVGVVETGPDEWVGRRVVAEINCVCGACDLCQRGLSNHCRNRTVMGIVGRDGCFADRVAVPIANLHAVPDVIPDDQAVYVEPLAAAFQVLQQCRIDARMRVSVLGSGRLGLLVAQVIKPVGCRLDVIGRNPVSLTCAEKVGIQPIHVDALRPGQDRDVVIDCTGTPDGLDLAMGLVRPRGTIILKSTHAGSTTPNLAPIVINEVTLLGSRCGPFPPAIDALARGAVNVEVLTSAVLPLDRGLEALEQARRKDRIKVLLNVSA